MKLAEVKHKIKGLNTYSVYLRKQNGEFKQLTEVPFRVMYYVKRHCSMMSRSDVREFVKRHRKSLIKRLKMPF